MQTSLGLHIRLFKDNLRVSENLTYQFEGRRSQSTWNMLVGLLVTQSIHAHQAMTHKAKAYKAMLRKSKAKAKAHKAMTRRHIEQ
jgi:hypothetical protein